MTTQFFYDTACTAYTIRPPTLAGVMAENERAIRYCQKIGFRQAGLSRSSDDSIHVDMFFDLESLCT